MSALQTTRSGTGGVGLIAERLAECIERGCVLVGVGNVMRGDDGFGPRVIEGLRCKTSLPLLDGGMAPENWLGPITRLSPAVVVVLDAVVLDAPTGSLHWLNPDQLQAAGVSTHASGLDMFLLFLAQAVAADVNILGTVPDRTGLGDSMSEEVGKAAEQLISIISQLCPPTSDCGSHASGSECSCC